MFADALQGHGDMPAFVLPDGSTLGYRALAERADAVFAAAAAPRTRHAVAIECTNGWPTVAAYLGALRRRVPALLVDALLEPALRERLYARFGIAHVQTADGQWRATGCAAQVLPHPDLALLLSTSGSTGEAKLVKLTRANLQANAASIASYLGLTASDRPITTLPLHYSYGLSVLNSHLAVGATVLLTDESVVSAAFWQQAKAQRASSLAGVPATWAMLRKLRFERMDLPALHTLTQAGGALPLDDARWLAAHAAAHGRRLVLMYGQTEATARIAWLPPERLADKLGSIGIAIPGGRLTLVDEQGREIEQAGQHGELVYHGANVMMGYACEAGDLAAPDQLQQTLRTGDVGWRDEDGYFFISGRLKRFIKVFGKRIGLDEVEAQLRAAGHEAAVTGRDEHLIVATCDPACDTAALATWVATRYRLHPSAIQVARVEAFPRSAAGKLQYAALQAMVAA